MNWVVPVRDMFLWRGPCRNFYENWTQRMSGSGVGRVMGLPLPSWNSVSPQASRFFVVETRSPTKTAGTADRHRPPHDTPQKKDVKPP